MAKFSAGDLYRGITNETYAKVWDRTLYEWRCEDRARRWFGWTGPYSDWTPEMRRQERQEARRRRKENRAARRAKP